MEIEGRKIMKEPAGGINLSSVEKRASDTAMFAAIHRFISSLEEHPDFKGPDHLARLFVPSKAKFLLSFAFIRRHVRKKLTRMVPGTYEYVVARTKYFDDLFKQALTDNIPQIVFLGAGYDTRSIRFKDFVRETKIFELDVPTTQKQKKDLLLKAGICLPEQLSFVPINFNRESLQKVLSDAGYDKTQKSFFIWEGVTYYLPDETVKNTLGIIKNYSGAGSTVVFDYFYKSIVQGKSDSYGARELIKEVSKSGEPFQFGIDQGEIEPFLAGNGFDILSHHTPEEFEKTYLYADDGEFFGKMYGFACHVHARVKP